MASFDTERTRAFHQDADVPRGRLRRFQTGRQPVPDTGRQVTSDTDDGDDDDDRDDLTNVHDELRHASCRSVWEYVTFGRVSCVLLFFDGNLNFSTNFIKLKADVLRQSTKTELTLTAFPIPQY